MAVHAFNCPNCGYGLTIDGLSATVRCPACASTVLVPPSLLDGDDDAPLPPPPADQAGTLAEIEQLVHDGRKIEAIRQFRELFGVSLAEAQEAVERIAADDLSSAAAGIPDAAMLFSEIRTAINTQNKIEAIKRLRETHHHIGLKDAKDIVDDMDEGRLTSASQFAERLNRFGPPPRRPDTVSVKPASTPASTTASSPQPQPKTEKSSRALFDRIRELIAEDKKLEAVKYVRENTGLGLKESKDLVDSLEQGNVAQSAFDSMLGALLNDVAAMPVAELQQVYQLIRQGEHDQAARLYQRAFNTSAHDASAAVQAIARGEPVFVGQHFVSVASPGTMEGRPARPAAKPTPDQSGSFLVSLFVWVFMLGIAASIIFPIGLAITEVLPSPWGDRIIDLLSRPIPAYATVIERYDLLGGQIDMEDARAVAVDSAGNIYLNSHGEGRIVALTPNGQYSHEFSLGSGDIYLSEMLIGPDDNLYVAFQGSLYRYRPTDGTFIEQITFPTEVQVEDFAFGPVGTLYVYGVANFAQNLLVFSPTGDLLLELSGGIARYTEEPDSTVFLDVDTAGNIYLLGENTEAILIINPQGQLITRINSPEDDEDPGAFDYTLAYTVDDRGHSLLATFDRILVYGPDGALLAGFNTVGGVAYGFAPGPNNTFYVTNSQDQLVRYQVNR